MIKALSLSSYLRSQRNFGPVIKAVHAWDADGSDDEGEDPDKTVGVSSLLRGYGRADITGRLLHRREWHASVVFDTVESVTLHTDASPQSGSELQGMVAQVRKTDASHYLVTLPGASLPYGFMDVMSKSIALLWAIWLLCGPAEADVQYFLNKVISITTDGGAEAQTTMCPNVLPAFIAWISGTPWDQLHTLVRPGEVLFPVAIRIS